MGAIVSRNSRPSNPWYLFRDGVAYFQNKCRIHVKWNIRVQHNPSGDVKNKRAWSHYQTINPQSGEQKVSFKNGHLIKSQNSSDYGVTFKFIPKNDR